MVTSSQVVRLRIHFSLRSKAWWWGYKEGSKCRVAEMIVSDGKIHQLSKSDIRHLTTMGEWPSILLSHFLPFGQSFRKNLYESSSGCGKSIFDCTENASCKCGKENAYFLRWGSHSSESRCQRQSLRFPEMKRNSSLWELKFRRYSSLHTEISGDRHVGHSQFI